MGEDNVEDKLLNRHISFSIKDMKWVITSGVALILWIVTAILWVKDKDAQSEKIKNLESQNSTLEKQVATLEGQIKGVENASNIFMQNPPSELKFRIDLLEKRIGVLELPGSNPPPPTITLDTSNVVRRGH